MKRGAAVLLTVGVLLLFLGGPGAAAYDNTNSTNLQQAQGVNQQLLGSTVTQMASQTNDPQLQALASQFQSALASGNPAAEQAALSNLQSYSKLAQDSPALSALVNSMSASGSGISVNPSTLASLLGAFTPTSQGIPSNMGTESPQQLESDINSLIGLLNGVDPALVSQLLSDLAKMGLSFPGLNSFPSLPSFGGLPLGAPAVGGLSVGGAGGVASLSSYAIPIAIAVAAAVLFIFRNKLRALLRGQTLPGSAPVLELDEEQGDPRTARGRVIRAFNGMLKAMSLRGAVRVRSETHREFASRCRGREEGGAVGEISGYYEKAKFSASDVGEGEAASAERALSDIEGAGRR